MTACMHSLPCEYQRCYLHLTSVGLTCTFFDMPEQPSPYIPRRRACPLFPTYPQMSRCLYHVSCYLLTSVSHSEKKPHFPAFLSLCNVISAFPGSHFVHPFGLLGAFLSRCCSSCFHQSVGQDDYNLHRCHSHNMVCSEACCANLTLCLALLYT